MQTCATELPIMARGSNQGIIKEEPYDINGFNPPNDGKKRKDQNAMMDLSNISDSVIELSSSDSEDENTDSSKQLVVYNPSVSDVAPIEAFPDLISYKIPPFRRALPSVGAYTVQCANCFKWRLIPTQVKYEEIREHIMEKPFVCATAHEWRSYVSCDDPPDIEQDGSRLWAIDKPNIAQPPPGWKRDVRIRGEGSTKFADIYYTSPKGTKLRSICDVEKYLFKHPEYAEQGVTLAQFSFQIPKPLQENYVRKRPPRVRALKDGNYMGMPGSFEPDSAIPMALPGENQNTNLQLAIPGISARCAFSPMNPPLKKPRSAPGKPRHNSNLLYEHHEM